MIAIIATFQQFIDNKIIKITPVFTDFLNEEEIISEIKEPFRENIYVVLGIEEKEKNYSHAICLIKCDKTESGIRLLTKNSWGKYKGYKEIVNHEGYIEPGVLKQHNEKFKYWLSYVNYTMTIPTNQRQRYVEQELFKTFKNVIEICRKEIIPSNVAVPSEDTKKGTRRSFWSRLFTRRTKGGTKKSLYKTRRKIIHKRKTRKYLNK